MFALGCQTPVTVDALPHMFATYDSPLVLKTDNGSHLVADAVLAALDRAGVHHLPSPPLTPRYNGSVEAGIGSIKTRTLLLAAAHGRADGWTCDDLEAARLEANAHGRPRGRSGPAPEELWNTRLPISPAQRRAFADALAAATLVETDTFLEHHRAPPHLPPGRAVRRVSAGDDRPPRHPPSPHRPRLSCGQESRQLVHLNHPPFIRKLADPHIDR